MENSVVDKAVLNGGAYEKFGELSGWRWRKINMFPVYSIEPIQLVASASETGVNFETQTTFFVPSIYEIQPHVHDMFMYDYISKGDNPLQQNVNGYEVVNIEKSSQSKITFWKVSAKMFGDISWIDYQISGNYTFIDYEKQIYETRNAINLHQLILKNTKLGINDYFDRPCGLYMEKPRFKVAEQT
jgi:hypothetical protein